MDPTKILRSQEPRAEHSLLIQQSSIVILSKNPKLRACFRLKMEGKLPSEEIRVES